MENFFTIAIDTCNHERWIEQCLDSCLTQRYNNFEVILVDALSDDTTYEIAKEYSKKYKNLKIFQNEIRLPQVANFLWLTKLSKPNSIIVSVDGDDWLNSSMVLHKLNETYNSDEIWMTYGTYVEYPHRSVSHIYKPYPEDIIKSNQFRNFQWLASHLRTWRRELLLKIDESEFKFDNGEWFNTTGDQAIMLPMLELSGEKSRYISDILYVYNVDNQQRDTVGNESKQIELSNYIRSKTKLQKIENL